jgi:hypothetical protein
MTSFVLIGGRVATDSVQCQLVGVFFSVVHRQLRVARATKT